MTCTRADNTGKENEIAADRLIDAVSSLLHGMRMEAQHFATGINWSVVFFSKLS